MRWDNFLCSVRMEICYVGKVTWCCTTGSPPLEVAPGQRKAHVNGNRRQTVDRDKINPGVTELLRVYVKRPLGISLLIFPGYDFQQHYYNGMKVLDSFMHLSLAT